MNTWPPGFDWRMAWIEYNQTREAPDGVNSWDERAESFVRHARTSPYADTFIDLLALQPKQSILDVGCGGGTLAIPLAHAGHEVFAVDFSQGMLAALRQSAQQQELAGIRSALLDFNAPWEDWEAVGITENCVDIAVASRSTMVVDLEEAFTKLERAARTKVAITMATEFRPRRAKRINSEHVRNYPPDFTFAINLLFQRGRYPELRFIDSYKPDEQGAPRLVRWAFISWPPYSPYEAEKRRQNEAVITS
jgi:SAM-dependent methyltransferase